MSRRELLFSVTKKDFDIQTFRAGGKGGQHQNKTNSGVRIVHRASGAVGESREHRSQLQNKKTAFLRLVATPEFKRWHKIETAKRLMNRQSLEDWLDEQLRPHNLRIEYGPFGEAGR